MSEKMTQFKTTEGDMTLVRYWGGDKRGTMIQCTQGLGTMVDNDTPGFIQLTPAEALRLSRHLIQWVTDVAEDKRREVADEIAKDKQLERTIFKDIRDSHEFIASLEIPQSLLDSLYGARADESEG